MTRPVSLRSFAFRFGRLSSYIFASIATWGLLAGCGGSGTQAPPAISVSISPTSVTLIGGASQTFTATVTNDSANAGVTWTASTGTITTAGVYTAPAVVTTTSATVTATSKTDTTKSAATTIALTPISVSVSPTTATLIGGASQTFTATVTADGANAGVTWTASAGMITAAGVYTAPAVITATSATVTATSKTDTTKSASATITLTPISISFTTSTTGITLDSGQTLSLAASVVSDGSASGATFAATGAGTVAPTSATGNSPATTLTATGTVASAVTVTVTSIKDTTKSDTTASITVNPALAITTAAGSLTAGVTNTTYGGATIAASGGTGTKTFTIASGSLPTGLSLSASGVISGTPTGSTGTSTFAVKVTDSATTPVTVTSGSYTIAITAAPLVWTSPSTGTLTYTVGTAITPITLSTTGGTGAVTYSVNSGTLPTGLSITGNTLSGTPTAPTVVAGNTVNFLATDSATPTHVTATSASVTMVVNPVTLAIISTALPSGTISAPYSYQLTSTGGTGAITWSLSAGSLTGTGLSLSSTGLLSGTPTATETALSLTFQAKDSATNQQQTVTKTLSLTVTNALTITTASLANAMVGSAYNATLAAAGGSGTGYTWTVTAGATGSNSLATLNLGISSGGAITGTPTAAGTANFTVQVKDSANNTASASFSITAYAALLLPSPNPTSLGSATTGASYTGSITATGGVPSYTWTVNGSSVPTTGTQVSLSNGLYVTNTGTGVLNVGGTPTTTATVTFTAKVADSTSASAGPFTYTIAVSTTYTVSGNISLVNNCNGITLPAVTVSINTTPVRTTTTDGNGNFSFSNLPNGTYTLTPSITGPSSVFYPATHSVTVASGNITGSNFSTSLGYTVSGTVAYAGSKTGQIYLSLNSTNCGGGGSPGTSVSTAGSSYTIRGVAPGPYTLQAFMDNLGEGASNASNPTGNTSVTVASANFTGANVTLADPATVTLASAPTLQGAAGFNTGAIAQYKPLVNSNGVETATSYTLQWSTTSTFTTVAGSKTFPANGTQTNVLLVNGLTNDSVYYFRLYGTSAGTATSAYSSVFGPVTIGAPTGGNTVSGSVTFAATPTGPLYVAFYNSSNGAVYAEYIASPSSAQAYSIQVPSGSYDFVGILDQNNNGIVDAGDVQNTNSNNTTTTITGATANENLTLPTAFGTATVSTQNYRYTGPSGSNQNYSLNFQVAGLIKRPVAVTLSSNTNASGANAVTPLDLALCDNSNNCGSGFQANINIGGTSPSVGDSYTFALTYSDGTTGNLTATVTGVLTAFATNLLPSCTPTCSSTSTTPTFTWTDPANASSYTYQFEMNDNNGNMIWQIPGDNSNSNGFSSSTTSITWGTDPTGGGSTPSIPSLVTGTNYVWQIQLQDSNGNQATTQVTYQP